MIGGAVGGIVGIYLSVSLVATFACHVAQILLPKGEKAGGTLSAWPATSFGLPGLIRRSGTQRSLGVTYSAGV
jgi:hypothetical protein